MPFDPDAYLSAAAKTSYFDPDAYLGNAGSKSFMQKAGDAFLSNPVGAAAAEGAAAVNRGATQLADFLTTDQVNNVSQIMGSDYRMPSITETLSPATQGGFMEPGLPREIVRTAGEVVPGSIAMGGALRSAAQQLPAAAQGIGATLLRGAGTGTATADAGYGALSGVGTEVGREAGGDQGALVGSVVAPLAPVALAQAGKSVISKLFGAKNPSLAAKTLEDFASFDSIPTAGMVTGRTGLQGLENVSSKAMGGSPLRKASDKIAENMQKKLGSIANQISTKEGAETAGLQVQKGITGPGGFMDKFRQNGAVLWNKSDSFLNPSAPVNITNTAAELDDMVRGGVFGFLDTPAVAQIKSVFDSGAVADYKTLRELRSSIGMKLGQQDLMPDIPRRDLNRLYGAITKDIKAHANAVSPEALKAFERANGFTRIGHERIDDHLQRIANKVNPDQVFRDLAKGGEGVKAIQTVKKSIPTQDWEVVASNIVRRLGRSNSGAQNAVGEEAMGDAFSVNKFVTDWDKLGPARQAIFSGSKKLDKYGADLAKIARAASVVKEAGLPAANASGSAQAGSRYAAGSAAVASAVTLNPTPIAIAASSIAFNNMGARIMTNPKFVALLAGQGNRPLSSAFISSLVGLAKESSAQDSADIYEFAKELETKLEESK